MKIAILGWGSLIWDPRSLKFEANTGWLADGPKLPIEFARISKDGRLTLVIKVGASEVQTLYAISSYLKLDEAILDLAIREGCGKDKIGVYVKESDLFKPTDFALKANIITWINNSDFDAVIWTNLKTNFKDKYGFGFSEELALNYMKYLTTDKIDNAEEYIRKAPISINTSLRKKIEKELNWYPM